MKVKWNGMLGTNHSWSFTSQHLARAMHKLGHEVFLKSTNGLEHFPDDLKPLLIPGYHDHLSKGPADFLDGQGNETIVNPQQPKEEIRDDNGPYDLEIAYTIPFQGPRRFSNDSKMKAIIWNFESSILPYGWPLYARSVDYLLPSSQYCYDMFLENGIPEEKLRVLPLGVDTNMFNSGIEPFELKTQKKVKFLHNAIPHHRKLHERVIKGYIEAFSGKDDVCLVLKTRFIKESKQQPFEVDVEAILNREMKNKKNPPEIEVVNTWIPNISSLYNACDAVVSMSSAEGFWLPGLEALACEKLIIAPRHGGQLDFLNDDNSLLIDTGEMEAPVSMQYWGYMEGATVGDPSIKHFKELMWRVYKNTEEEKKRIIKPSQSMVENFSWDRGAKVIGDLPGPTRVSSPKKQVLFVVPYKMVGGGEVWVKEAIERLDDVFEPHIALVSGSTPAMDKLFENSGAVIEDLSDKGKNKGLKCLIESSNYSIIHFYNSNFIYNTIKEAWSQGFRSRVVETVHSELNWNDSMQKVGKREPCVMAIHAVSRHMGREILKKGNKNVVVLPQHIDWDRFAIERSKDILDEFNIKKDFVVGFVGRVSPEKNVPTVLECAKMLPDVSFVVVGDGPQYEPIKQLSNALPNLHLVGRRTDTEKFFAAFDLLMLPSSMEGLPLVILEAMTAGTPAVASDVGAISEIVLDDITGSLIWNPGDPSLFAKSILNFKNDQTLWSRCSANSISVAKAMKEKTGRMNVNNFYNMLFPRGGQ